MIKRYLGLFLVVLLTLVIVSLGLMASETGSRWLLVGAEKMLPGEFKVNKSEGDLLSLIKLNGLSYKNDTVQIQIDKLDFGWQPTQLFTGTLKIKHFIADGIAITTTPGNKPEESKGSFADGISLPVQPDINTLHFTNISINHAGNSHIIHSLQLSAKAVDNQIQIQSLSLDSDIAKADATGTISTNKGFPLDLKLNWLASLDKSGKWQGSTQIAGDMNKLNVDGQLTLPFKFNLHGDLQELLALPKFNLKGEWGKLNGPFAPEPPQIQSPKGAIQITGLLSDYQLQITSQLTQKFLPAADLTFNGKGNMDGINIEKLDITSSTGLFRLTGNAGWKPAPVFDVSVSGVDFNPAILVPELPGSLNFSTRIKGKIESKATQLTAELNKVAGQLRQQPFQAIGILNLNGEQLKVSGLQLESGSNKLAMNGNIGKNTGDLVLDINMPKMSSLWPTLAGKLEGGGHIQGGWGKPTINLHLEGKALKFAEFGAERLAVDADYAPDDKKSSTLKLTASKINGGSSHIDKIAISAKGSLKKHSFNLDLISPKGNLAAALSGSWVEPAWRGELARLDLSERNGDVWELAQRVPIRAEQKKDGIELAMDEACLTQQASALCTKITKFANSDLDFQLIAHALPSRLIQPWLGQDTTLTTTLDGEANFKQRNKKLGGDCRFDTKPTIIRIKNKEFHLQPSFITGNIDEGIATANLDLSLAGEDYLRSRLKLDIGPKQNITGKINANIADFSPLQALLPQVDSIKGRLKAELDLYGTIGKPLIQGNLDLAKTDIDIGGFGLRNLAIDGKIDSSQGNRLMLQGSAQPLILNDPEAKQNVNLKSLVNFSADLRQTPQFKGEFLLDLPATQLSVRRGGQSYDIDMNRSTIKGQVLDDTLFADIDLVLPRQDYVRGKLRLAADEPKSISAQLNAAINDFKLVEAFAPELSNVKGAFTADVSAEGTLTHPQIQAKLDFANGGADVDRLGISLREINLHAFTPVLTNDLIQLRGSAQSGNGKLDLDGTISLDSARQRLVDLAVRGKDFEVAKIPEAEVAISPDLKILAANTGTRITGTIAVPKALLKMQEIPENAVKVSPDEIILGEELPEERKISAPGVYTDILVTLGKSVNFSGQGLTSDLKGQLRIVKDNDKLALQGNVNMANGKYKSYGQDLTVRKGQFIFNGPADNPWLNVEAVRVSKDKKVTAILTLNGSLENPQTHISSEPSLPESEALAYLISGGPLSQVSKSEGNVLASAAISYGADQASWLAEKLGLSDFSVQQGSTLKDTLLVMGKYLTPDFYMGAKVGMFNKQAVVVLKHNLIENVNVETQAGTSQRVKLNYEFDGE